MSAIYIEINSVEVHPVKRSLLVPMLLVLALLGSTVPSGHVWGVSAASQVSLRGNALAWDVVNLTWTPVDGARAYEVYRSTDQASLFDSSNLLMVVNWSSYPQYEAGKTYTQGDTVEYSGKVWRAKYWTQSAPGSDDSWELIGDAAPATSYLDQWNLTANTTYYYAVVPVLSDGSTGGASNTLIITTPYEPYRITVYYISWGRYERKFYVSDIPWEKVTTVNYAFLDLKENGTVTYFDTYADPLNLEEMKEYKRKYPAVKVLVSVGGWTLSKYFSPVAADPAKRLEFARSVLRIIRKYDLDGVDIDWEYPGGGGMEGNYASPDDGKNFVLLLKTIREVFNQAEEKDHEDYMITVAAPADPVKAGRINWTEASRYLDAIDVMTYDYHGAWEDVTGFLAPLYADPNAPYTDPNVKWHFNVNYTIQWYIQHVPDRTKIVLGLPFYSRSFANVPSNNDGLYQPFSGTPDGTWGPASETYGVMDYWDVAEKNQSADYEYHWNPYAQEAWLYSPSKKVFITFDDPRAIGIRVDYALSNGIGGVMIWEITADRKPGTNSHPLLDTVLDHFGEKPPAWIPDTYYIGSSVPANLTVPEPGYGNSTGYSNQSNQTGGTGGSTGGNQTSGNQTSGGSGGSGYGNQTNQTGGTGGNQTTGSSNLLKPDAFSVKVSDWGDTEYDVNLDLGQEVDWVVKVKLREGSSISSFWSVSKAEEDGYVVFTPASWNKGPTASFGFIAKGSKPVEAMYLYVDNQLWDVWPGNITANGTAGGTGDNSTGTGNQTGGNAGNSGGSGTGNSGNQTGDTGGNQTGNTGGNQTGGGTGGTGGNQTSSDLIKPDAFGVKVTDWGDTEYDVTLNLGGTYDWVVKVKLEDGSSISSSWSANRAEEDGYIVFTPVSWNKGPTASFGFIAKGSKPVEAMYLYVNNQLWDVWPDSAVVGNQTGSGTGDNQTGGGTGGGTGNNQTGGGTGGSGNTTTGNTTYVPAGPGLPEHFFAPYIDMSLESHRPLVEYYNLTGTPYFTLAFILYGSAYNGPSWAGSMPLNTFLDEVRNLRRAGGDVIISFGGAVGPYLCQQAQSAEQLADWYLQVADLYNATYFDFDIESSINADLLADALLIVQNERPGMRFSFTLPTDPGAGLVGAGYSIIQKMAQKGVHVDRVNAMTMDYYWTPANAENAISVAEHLFNQLKQIYPDRSDDEIWGMIGLTPMIGTNDDKSVFTLDDAQDLVDWAIQHGIRSLAFWSVDRDHPGPNGQVSPTHRGTSDPDWAFSHVFVEFMTAFATTAQAQAVPVPA